MTASCPQCSSEFDSDLNHDGVKRRAGPARIFCSRACLNRSEHLRNGRDRCLQAKYGITLDEYTAMWNRQGGRCLLCRRVETTISKDGWAFSLGVDHCHETGEVRGLLCVGCNRGVGFLQDNADLLERAAAYIRGELR